jgi:DNA-binding MarR family transcriptional regulator
MVRLSAGDTLPPSCLRVLAYLFQREYQRELPPTFQEIADAMGYSVAAVDRILRRLRSAGFLTWQPHIRRTIRLTCLFFPIAEDESHG